MLRHHLCPPLERPPGYDRVRNAEIGNKDFELDVLEEAYTTEHWLVRIYKVRPQIRGVWGNCPIPPHPAYSVPPR